MQGGEDATVTLKCKDNALRMKWDASSESLKEKLECINGGWRWKDYKYKYDLWINGCKEGNAIL